MVASLAVTPQLTVMPIPKAFGFACPDFQSWVASNAVPENGSTKERPATVGAKVKLLWGQAHTTCLRSQSVVVRSAQVSKLVATPVKMPRSPMNWFTQTPPLMKSPRGSTNLTGKQRTRR